MSDETYQLNQKIKEAIAIKFHSIDEEVKGNLDYKFSAWRDKYAGPTDLPERTVCYNRFKVQVDNFTSVIMSIITDSHKEDKLLTGNKIHD